MSDSMGRVLCDMHSHILPGIDDGCKDEAMALTMLQQASEQGVDAMICTPHYYPTESIAAFLQNRAGAIRKIIPVIRQADFRCPKLYVGAEVAYYRGLLKQPDLHKLCIGQTDYLLLELPFHQWDEHVLDDVLDLREHFGIHPIIAHLERFLKLTDKASIDTLLELPVLIQMNGEYILDHKTARKAKKMLAAGTVALLGSDTHHPVRRPQTMGLAYEQLDKWKLGSLADQISARSAQILNF